MLFSYAYLLASYVPQALGQAWTKDFGPGSNYRGERALRASAPGNISDEDWPSLMADYDLIRRWPIIGYNISQPYEDADSIDGWAVSLTVRAKIPAKGVVTKDDTDAVFAGSMIRLEPPSALVDDVVERQGFYTPHPSWRVSLGYYFLNCNSRFSGHELERLVYGNGSCEDSFNDTCLDALENSPNWNGREWEIGNPRNPPECKLTVDMTSILAAENYTRWSDEISKDKAKTITWLRGTEFVSFVSPLNTPDQYGLGVRDASYSADMVLVTWGYTKNRSSESYYDTEEARQPVSKLVCMRGLNNTPEENKRIEDERNEGKEGKEREGEDDSTAVGGRETMLPTLVLFLPLAALFALL
ncbi:hypothetical protein CDV31_015303 [Fusarium ambrosium]|uniref:Uncharacterized protein n=1 Tax=Fusarium ambrosium TaxID=131363 RepID=A0A428SQN7_9HYPO|nr:hypothetical protein CDV31_015303 [Fusarium ambrosium]